MERAAGDIIGAFTLQIHIAAHHIDNVDAVQHIFYASFGDHSKNRSYSGSLFLPL